MDGSSIDRGAPLRVVCGPTAAGKTAIACWLAQQVPLSVISADSRQLYRRFDVGTAKPSEAERRQVPHLGIDVLHPTERASAAWWAEHAEEWIMQVDSEQRAPIVVGGTGLYLRALFGSLFAEPVLDLDRRRLLEEELARHDTETLRRWASELDPARAHLGRTQLLRAIEIALLTGHRVSELHRTHARSPRWRARYLLVDPGPPLAGAIERRTRAMFANGWPDEVRTLMDEIPEDAPAWNATGYRTIRDMVEGRLTQRDAQEHVIIHTRQYAKRQRTWFRHQLPPDAVTRLDPNQPDWQAVALAWWRA